MEYNITTKACAEQLSTLRIESLRKDFLFCTRNFKKKKQTKIKSNYSISKTTANLPSYGKMPKEFSPGKVHYTKAIGNNLKEFEGPSPIHRQI